MAGNYFDQFDAPAPATAPVNIDGSPQPIPVMSVPDISQIDSLAPPSAPDPDPSHPPVNYFDQFDANPAPAPAAPAPSAPALPANKGNYFDQFDAPPATAGPDPSLWDVVKGAFGRGLYANYQAAKANADYASSGKAGPAPQLPNDALAKYTTAPYDYSFGWPNLKKIVGKTLFGLTENSPEMGAAVAGGVAGNAAGFETPASIVTTPVGSLLAVYGAHVLKSTVPVFEEELAKSPNDPDAAWDRTKARVKIEGISSGASFAAFGVNPFENEIKNLVFQTVGAQPAVGAGEQVASNVSQGKPVLQDVPHAALDSAANTAVPLLAHVGLQAALPGETPAPETSAEPTPGAPPEPPQPAAAQNEPVPAAAAAAPEQGNYFDQFDQQPAPPAGEAPTQPAAAESEPPAPEPQPESDVPQPPAAAPDFENVPPGYHTTDLVDQVDPGDVLNPGKNMNSQPLENDQYITDEHFMLEKDGNEDVTQGYTPAPMDDTYSGRVQQLMDQIRAMPDMEEFKPAAGFDPDAVGDANAKPAPSMVVGKIGDRTAAIEPRYFDYLVRQKGYTLKGQAEDHAGLNPIGIYKDDNLIGAISQFRRSAFAPEADTAANSLAGALEPGAVTEPGKPYRRPNPDRGPAALKAPQRNAARAAKEDVLGQLKNVMDISRKGGAYDGPEEVTINAPSGQKTNFKLGVKGEDAAGVYARAEDLYKKFSKRAPDVFYSVNPETLLSDRSEAPDESRQPPAGRSPYKQQLLSMRRNIWRDNGIDPAVGENMPPMKQFKTAQDIFKNKFNLDIEMSPRANMAEALNNIKDQYVEFQTLAALTKLPEDAIGLRGVKIGEDGQEIPKQLKLVYTEDRPGGALGAYMRDLKQINQPGRARSVAHEWMHALDYHILDVMGKTQDSLGRWFRGYSAKIRREGEKFSPDTVGEAWVDLMNTVYYDDAFKAAKTMDLEKQLSRAKSPASIARLNRQMQEIQDGNYKGRDYRSVYFRAAKSLPALSDAGYWTRPTEMLARAFEAWVADRGQKAGAKIDILSARPDAYFRDTAAGNPFEAMYPQGADRDRIFRAFDAMMNRVSDSNILGTGKPAQLPEEGELADPLMWFKKAPGYVEPKGSIRDAMIGTPESRARLRQQSARMLGLMKDENPHPKKVVDMLHDGFMWMATATGRQLRVLEARNPESPSLTRMINAVYGDPGRGRYTGPRFDQITHGFDQYLNVMDKMLDRTGLDREDKPQMDALTDLLWGITDKAPEGLKDMEPKLRAGAKTMRELWDGAYAKARENYGVDLSYIKDENTHYINRVNNLPYILNHTKESIDAFAQAYKMKYEDEIQRGELVPGKNFDIDSESIKDANDLVTRLTVGSEEDSQFMKPRNDLSKRRTFPGRADPVLRNVRITNPVDAFETYIKSLGRRSAWTKLLEPTDGAFEDSFKNMLNDGVNPDDIKQIRQLILSVTGRRPRTGIVGRAADIGDYVNGILTMTMLGRVAFAGVHGFGTAGFRTGDFRDSLGIFGHAFKQVWDRSDSRDRDDILQAYGIMASNARSSVVADLSGGFGDVPRVQAAMKQYFRRNLITPMVEMQRRSAVRMAQPYFLRAAEAILNPAEKPENRNAAIREFKESGVNPARIQEFAQYLQDRDGALPDIDKAFASDSDPNRLYAKMLGQFANDVVQHPGRVDRPFAANTPVGRVMAGFLSYTMGAYEHIFKRSLRVTQQVYKESGPGAAAAYFAKGVVAPYAVYWALATSAFAVRTALFNRQGFAQMTPQQKSEYLAEGGALYTAPWGPLADILLNVTSGAKYDKSVSSAFLGKAGYVSDIADNYIKAMNYQAKHISKDTANRMMLTSTYRLLAMPAAAVATAVVPVAPGMGTVMGMANMWIGSRDAQNDLADAVYGPPKPKARTDASGADLWGGGKPNKLRAGDKLRQ